MEINDALIDRLSFLSKLEFKGEKREAIKKDLSKIIDFVAQLEKVDTEGVEPLIHMTPAVNVLRKDVSEQEYTQKQALQNAPVSDSDYFKVPKVLGN